MEYQEVKCRNCGSPMHVAEDAERIRCPYCGTEYVLKSQCNEKNPVRIINYGGRGALFQSYIPAEWDYRVFDDNDSISILATVCKGLQLFSQDMSAQLLFYPFAFYKDSAPKASIFSSMGIPGLSSGGEYQPATAGGSNFPSMPDGGLQVSPPGFFRVPSLNRSSIHCLQKPFRQRLFGFSRRHLRNFRNRQTYFPASSLFASQPAGSFMRAILPRYLHGFPKILLRLPQTGLRIF